MAVTSPNVGKVTLDAVIRGDDLRSQLTKEIQKEVLPELAKLDSEIVDLNNELERVQGKGFAEVAREANIASDEVKKVGTATRQAERAEATYRTQVLATQKAIKARSAAASKARAEERRDGRASIETARALEEATERASIAVQKRNTDYAEWQARLINIQAAETESRRKYNDAVNAVRDNEIDGIRDLIRNVELARDAKINAALKASKAQIDAEQKAQKAAEDAEASRTTAHEREVNKRDRASARAHRAEMRRRRLEAHRAADEAGFRGLARTGRIFTGVASAASAPVIGVAAVALFNLAAAAAAALQSVTLVPAALGAVGTAAATLKIGLMGVEDAFSALWEIDADPEAYAEALEKLSPAAQRVMESFRAMLPYFQDIAAAIQDALFMDLEGPLTETLDKYLPPLKRLGVGIADIFNKAFGTFLTTLNEPEVLENFNTFIDNTLETMQVLSGVVAPLTRALGDLLAVGSDYMPDLANWLVELAEGAADWIAEMRANGELDEMMAGGLQALKDIASILGSIIELWMSTADHGEEKLAGWKREIGELVEAFKGLIHFLERIETLVNFIGAAIDTIINPFKGLMWLGSKIPGSGMPDPFTAPQSTPETSERSARLPAMRSLFGGAYAPPAPDSMFGAGGLGTPPTVQELIDRKAAEDEANKPLSDADMKKAIEDSFNPEDFRVDPWAIPGSPTVLPGGALKVTIPGLTIPGTALSGLPGLPGAVSAPTALAGTDAGSIANYIAQSAQAAGYSRDEAVAFVAQAFSESQLNPKAYGATTGDGSGGASGIFQFTPDTWADFGMGGDPLDAKANIDAYMRLAAARDPRAGDIRSRIAAISGGGAAWHNNIGMDWNEAMSRAQNLVGATPTTSSPLPVQMVPPAGGYGGANNVSGLGTGQVTPGIEALAQLVGQLFPGVNLGGWRPSDGPNTPTGHQRGVALDIGIQDMTTGDMINQFLRDNASTLGIKSTIWRDQWKDFNGNQSTVGGHQDHVHVEVDPAVAQAMGEAMAAGLAPGMTAPTSLAQSPYAVNGPTMIDPYTGKEGYFQVDQQSLNNAIGRLDDIAYDLGQARRDVAITEELKRQNLATEADLLDDQRRVTELERELGEQQAKVAEEQRGKFKNTEAMDYTELPFGDPRRILAGAIGGAGGTPEDIAALLGPIFGAGAQPLGQAAGSTVSSALSAINAPVRQAPPAGLQDLVAQRNPMAPFAMAGFDVPDYTVQGGGPEAQNLLKNTGQAFDASGRIFSDTGAMLDRSFSSLQAVMEAKLDQLESVMNQVKDLLGEEMLGPTVEAAVSAGIGGIATELGTQIGEAAAPIIAQAVAAAVPSGEGGGNPGAGLVNTGFNSFIGGAQAAIPGRAEGGPIYGGLPDRDSVPIMAMPGEHVFTKAEVQRLGGQAGAYAFRRALMAGEVRGFATGGGVIGNDTVGADFFGVSQIPIIGAIVNLLVRVLLKVLGIEIEVRDTLDEMTDEFRQFRGDAFEAFDASGRLMNDTSALLDRTGSSEEAAADERLRILKIVIEGLIKFVIEKLIVPIGKAVANALINAGAGAAGGAISGSFPGGSIVGGMVQSVISSAGSAAVDIGAQIFTDFALALTNVGVDAIGELFRGLLPGLSSTLLGGGLLAMIADPITGLFTGLLGPVLGIFTSLLGGFSMPFDEGGLATGIGFMPKATIRPERVLPPGPQTDNYERNLDVLERLARQGGGRTVEVNAPIYLTGSAADADAVRGRLLSLIGP